MPLLNYRPKRGRRSLWILALLGLTACGGSTKSEGQVDSQTGDPSGTDAGATTGGSAGTVTGSGGQADTGLGGAAGAVPEGAGGRPAPGSGGTEGSGGADVGTGGTNLSGTPGIGATAGSGGTATGTGGSAGTNLGGAPGSGGASAGAGGTGGPSLGGAPGSGGASAGAGGTGGPSLGGAPGSGGASAGAGGTGGSSLPGVGGDAGSGGQPGTCDEAAPALEQFVPDGVACTFVVRMSYTDYELIAYQVVCGDPRLDVTEAEARTTASQDTGFDFSGAHLCSEPDEDRLFAFEDPPSDFGAVGVVSAYTGLTVFGGSVIWSGAGEIVYPADWRPAAELGTCDPPDLVPSPRAIGPAYLSFDMMAPVTRVWSTALPLVMSLQDVSFQNVAVMFYPRTVGELDLDTAEFIVFVNWDWV